jgi:pimeloyl-ACP methyl ester carboxylesterase
MSAVASTGEQFCDVGRGVSLCYEAFGDPTDSPLLLVMGLGTQMVGWPEDFCRQLAARGFHVVRFDNRDIGRSTHFPGRPPTVPQLLRRRFPAGQYTLKDMAEDAAGLVRALDLAPAHVVGASMGGMIAQTLAAREPALVRSLVSIMSTTGNRRQGQPALGLYRVLLKRAPSDREGFIKHMERVFAAIGSTGVPQDTEEIREIAARSFDRGHDPAGPGRQLAAILASGDRTPDLEKVAAPTLVVHGSSDRLVRPSGGRATARAIPGARLMIVEGMGHDLPRAAWPEILDQVTEHARAAERVLQAA